MSNFIKNILFVIFFSSTSTAFSMEKVDSFFPLVKLSLQKASEVVTESFVRGVCDFEDTFRRLPVDLHQDFIDAIGEYSISCLKKTFVTCPVSEGYHSEYGDNIRFTAFSRDSKLLLQLIFCSKGNCCLKITRRSDVKLLVEFEWNVDAQHLKFLSDRTFEAYTLLGTIPVNFLVCILRIAREN